MHNDDGVTCCLSFYRKQNFVWLLIFTWRYQKCVGSQRLSFPCEIAENANLHNDQVHPDNFVYPHWRGRYISLLASYSVEMTGCRNIGVWWLVPSHQAPQFRPPAISTEGPHCTLKIDLRLHSIRCMPTSISFTRCRLTYLFLSHHPFM